MASLTLEWGIYQCNSTTNKAINECPESLADTKLRALDNDIVGNEVLIVFLSVSIFAALLAAIALIRRLQHSIYFLRTGLPLPDLITKSGPFTSETPLESLLAGVSDQQLFLALGYLSGILGLDTCQRTTFEINILLSLMLIACSLQVVNALGMEHFWMNPILAVIRVTASGFLFYETASTLRLRDGEKYIPIIPPLEGEEDHDTRAMLGPVYCLRDDGTEGLTESLDPIPRPTWQPSHQAYVLLAIYILVVLWKPTRSLYSRLHKRWQEKYPPTHIRLGLKPPEGQTDRDTPARRRMKRKQTEILKLVHAASLVAGLSLAIYIGATTLTEVFRLQKWVLEQYEDVPPPAGTETQLGSQLVIFSVWPLAFALIHVVSEKIARFLKNKNTPSPSDTANQHSLTHPPPYRRRLSRLMKPILRSNAHLHGSNTAAVTTAVANSTGADNNTLAASTGSTHSTHHQQTQDQQGESTEPKRAVATQAPSKPNLAGPLILEDGKPCSCIACESNAVLPGLMTRDKPRGSGRQLAQQGTTTTTGSTSLGGGRRSNGDGEDEDGWWETRDRDDRLNIVSGVVVDGESVVGHTHTHSHPVPSTGHDARARHESNGIDTTTATATAPRSTGDAGRGGVGAAERPAPPRNIDSNTTTSTLINPSSVTGTGSHNSDPLPRPSLPPDDEQTLEQSIVTSLGEGASVLLGYRGSIAEGRPGEGQ